VIDPAARARLDSWKQSLLDPADLLLDLADHGLPMRGDPVRLAFVLGAGGGLELDVPDVWLAPLRRAARDARADGDHVLWLALGMLTWDRGRVAPVVLWPVELASDGRLVQAAERAPRVNDVLAHALRDFDAELVMQGELDLAEILRTAGAIADAHGDWQLERTARIAVCSFARFELWRDLDALDLEPAAWLAAADAPRTLPELSLTDVLAPLDADGDQLAAIAAAGAGGSFVLHGPPGTGKSQTIANLVVNCASRGKTVLVVSDRMTALDTIHQRLALLGLGDFCAALHGSPSAVVETLGRVMERAFRPAAGPSADPTRLAELRAGLDAHRAALHAPGSLGTSVYDVLARLVELRTTPRAALAERDAPALDRAIFARRLAAVEALADAARTVEPVASHPWRAAEVAEWRDDLVDRARVALETSRAAVDQLAAAIADVGALVPGLIARTPDQLRALGALAELAAASPRPGAELLTGSRGTRSDDIGERVALIRARGTGSIDTPRDPVEFLAVALRHRALVAELAESFTEGLADLDAPALWTQLKRWTTGMAPMRFLALRGVRAEVRAAALTGRLETDEAMLIALEAAIAERACRSALEAAAAPAKRWFGELGGEPLALDLDAIEAAVAWGADLRRAFDRVAVTSGEAGRQAAWRALVAQLASAPDSATELRPFARLAEAVARWDASLAVLAAATGIASLGAGADHLASLRDQLAALHACVDAFADWVRFYVARRAALIAGIGPAVAAIDRGDLAAEALPGAWERATLLAWLDAELRGVPTLARFSGAAHHARVASFADIDRGALAFARSRAFARLSERVPRPTRNEDGEPAALRKELAASTARPLRELLRELPTLLPKLAPCVLATPHAVARHLDPALPAFDVVVFDEASRLPVAHALGALARGRAAVVVGDTRQIAPPTEGLLDVALEANLPELTLGTHYRSRHEDLFAFANGRYYGDRVELRPAPYGVALEWRRIDGAVEVAGDNRAEAYAIVDEVVARLRDPARRTRSLAIVTMSRAQQHLTEELLAAAFARDPALAAPGEPLLVGTPERLQGEERDDVLLSIAGTADALGALALPGAEKWLAVATTRAREHMTVFASLEPEDIAGDAPPAARDVAELLAFARAGGRTRNADAAPVSAITAAIARALVERGWVVHHDVGCGPYRIALAVVDPDDANRYVLAIEDDGSAYATAAVARDRDRSRAQALAQLGWRVHRIWALDWWIDAEREIQRAHGAIVAAIAAGRAARTVPTAPKKQRLARGSAPIETTAPADTERYGEEAEQLVALTRDSVPLATGSGPNDLTATRVKLPRGAIAIGPYIAASVPAGRRAPGDMFAPRHVAEVGKLVEQVLAAEAPIHVELLARRVAAYFGIGRVTPEVVDHVRRALAGRGRFGDEQGIVWRLDQDPASVPGVRVAGANAAGRRDIAEVPLVEVAAAARIVVERAHDVASADLVRDCARLLGFARITDKVVERVALGVQLAAARELIAMSEGRAKMPS
jgi:hypothetical protein